MNSRKRPEIPHWRSFQRRRGRRPATPKNQNCSCRSSLVNRRLKPSFGLPDRSRAILLNWLPMNSSPIPFPRSCTPHPSARASRLGTSPGHRPQRTSCTGGRKWSNGPHRCHKPLGRPKSCWTKLHRSILPSDYMITHCLLIRVPDALRSCRV